MLRWPSLVLAALSLSITSWSPVAAAQSEGAPLPNAPEPPPAPAEPPPPPSAEPAPPSAPPPASGSFPPPPASSGSLEPAPTPAPPAPARAAPPSSAAAAAPTTSQSQPPQRPSEGLFDERRRDDSAHRHQDETRARGTDQFKIGPVVGVGVPSILSFGGTLKITRFFGAGVNVGLIPKIKLNYYGDATLSYQHYDIYGRIYPFGGGFFLSGGAGYATVDGTLDASETRAMSTPTGRASATIDYNGKGSVRTLMLTALIGYFYTTSVGFSIGVDAGAQIPLAPSQITFSRTYDVTISPSNAAVQAQADRVAAEYVSDSDKSIRDSLEKIGRTVLPTVNLRIGWIL